MTDCQRCGGSGRANAISRQGPLCGYCYGSGEQQTTRFVVTASPVDDLDRWPPTHTFYVTAETTSDAVELATRLLSTKAAGLAVRSVVPRTVQRYCTSCGEPVQLDERLLARRAEDLRDVFCDQHATHAASSAATLRVNDTTTGDDE